MLKVVRQNDPTHYGVTEQTFTPDGFFFGELVDGAFGFTEKAHLAQVCCLVAVLRCLE
jgi:hypothetical protein